VKARGADFSSAQTLEHVRQLAGELDFAMVKATEGVDYVNPLLERQVHELRGRQVPVGYYHFLAPGVDPVRQWDHFESTIVLSGLGYAPVALDYEAAGTTDRQARAFIRRGRQRGFRVGLYGGEGICRRRLGQAWRWVAKWSATPPAIRWDLWQWSDGGGSQDYNVFHADKVELGHWWLRQSRRRERRRLRWWLHDETAGAALGPYRLAALIPVLVAYLARHPRTRGILLERK
jgi:GH25 family lysozyme M1 (1,4-beta-N-acetylmuramidase)